MPDQHLQSIVEKMVAAGEPEEDIALVIQHYKPQQAAQSAAPQKQGYLESGGMFGEGHILGGALKLAKAAINHPVESLAMAGGALGAGATAPVSVPAALIAAAGAGLGAAGGAGLGSIVNAIRGGENGPTDAAGVAKTMAANGAAGALGEGAGQGAAKIARAGGKLVYKAALRPSMGVQREFGDVAETGLREGAQVSEGGVNKIAGRLKQSGAKAKQMIADAEAGGASPVSTKEVAAPFKGVMAQGRNQAQLGRPDPRQPVVARLKAFAARNPNGIPLSKAQELKGEAQDLASRAYRAEDLGHPITDLSAASDRAMATGLRQGIEARVPGIADVNAHTQQLIGLERALEDATRRNVPGVGSLRTLLGDFMPATASHAGIAANALGQSSVLPASFRTALIAALAGQD